LGGCRGLRSFANRLGPFEWFHCTKPRKFECSPTGAVFPFLISCYITAGFIRMVSFGWFHSDGLQVEEAGSIFSLAFLYTRISWYTQQFRRLYITGSVSIVRRDHITTIRGSVFPGRNCLGVSHSGKFYENSDHCLCTSRPQSKEHHRHILVRLLASRSINLSAEPSISRLKYRYRARTTIRSRAWV
jgi:hypothetical protein